MRTVLPLQTRFRSVIGHFFGVNKDQTDYSLWGLLLYCLLNLAWPVYHVGGVSHLSGSAGHGQVMMDQLLHHDNFRCVATIGTLFV